MLASPNMENQPETAAHGVAQNVQIAVDLTLPMGKGDGVRFLLDRYGTPPTRAAFIGDSVPDIEGMQQVRLACCPANAVSPVKAFVASRGKQGYISPLVYADGEIDILGSIR
jgi:hydroxymethylpyrimidine pyrophosphatase-like HAD family hydrolase